MRWLEGNSFNLETASESLVRSRPEPLVDAGDFVIARLNWLNNSSAASASDKLQPQSHKRLTSTTCRWPTGICQRQGRYRGFW